MCLRCGRGRCPRRVECPTFRPMHWGTSICRRAGNTGTPLHPHPWPFGNGESQCSSGSSNEFDLCWGSEDRMELSSTQLVLQLLSVPSWELFPFTVFKVSKSKPIDICLGCDWRCILWGRENLCKLHKRYEKSIKKRSFACGNDKRLLAIISRVAAFSSPNRTRNFYISEPLWGTTTKHQPLALRNRLRWV